MDGGGLLRDVLKLWYVAQLSGPRKFRADDIIKFGMSELDHEFGLW